MSIIDDLKVFRNHKILLSKPDDEVTIKPVGINRSVNRNHDSFSEDLMATMSESMNKSNLLNCCGIKDNHTLGGMELPPSYYSGEIHGVKINSNDIDLSHGKHFYSGPTGASGEIEIKIPVHDTWSGSMNIGGVTYAFEKGEGW
jgi:hypothetical protein